MFVKSFNALALASVMAFGVSVSTAPSAQHGTEYTEMSPLTQDCILGLKSTTVYCPREIKDTGPSIDFTALPFLEDIHEEWRALNLMDLAHLSTRSDQSTEPALPALLDRDSHIGGTNNFALVCLHDKGLTNDCQKNWGYYCTANGALATTKKETDEGCDTCECIDLNPKPFCMLGITGALYCQRDIERKGPSSMFQPYVPDTTIIENSSDRVVEGSEPNARDRVKSLETTGLFPGFRN